MPGQFWHTTAFKAVHIDVIADAVLETAFKRISRLDKYEWNRWAFFPNGLESVDAFEEFSVLGKALRAKRARLGIRFCKLRRQMYRRLIRPEADREAPYHTKVMQCRRSLKAFENKHVVAD